MTLTERVLKGRQADQCLNDKVLNEAFDLAIERWLKAIIRAKPIENDAIIEAKRRIDAIQEVRATLKSWVDDGNLALAEQEDGDE